MNERIKELALQAGFKTDKHGHLFGSDDIEKFAELIVRECIGIVDDAVLHREPASTYVGKIKQHFGVEE